MRQRIDATTWCMPVPGGWIVRSQIFSAYGAAIHQVFVADSIHEWKLPEEPGS